MPPYKFGLEMDNVIKNHKTVMQTQRYFLKGIENFFSKNFDYYSKVPMFDINGTITSGPSSTPCIGKFGTIATYIFLPFTTDEWSQIIKPNTEQEILNYKFYERLSHVVEKFLTEKLKLTIDAKGISATIPIPSSSFVFNTASWGQSAQTLMDGVRPDSHELWISKLNEIGDQIWNNILPIINTYSSPCAGGVFSGTHTMVFT